MNGDNDREQRLEDVDRETTAPPIPPVPSDTEPDNEYDEFMEGLTWKEAVNALLDVSDNVFLGQGLSPMNPMQRTLIRVGVAGVVKKYNLDLDLSDYPEIVLAAGVLWTLYDKKMEAAALTQGSQVET